MITWQFKLFNNKRIMNKQKLAQIWAQLEEMDLVNRFRDENLHYEMLGDDDYSESEDGVNSPEIQESLIGWLTENGVTI